MMKTLIFTLFLVTLWAPVVFAGENEADQETAFELTLEKAISRALGFSNSLEKARLELDEADDATVPAATGWYVSYSEENEQKIVLAESTDFSYEKARKSLIIERDSVILDAYDKYYEVLRKQEDLEAKKAALEKAKQNLKVTRSMYNVGMTTQTAVGKLETDVLSKEADVVTAQTALENAYASLNQLVRLDEDDRPVLTDSPVFEPIDLDKELYIQRILHESPKLWTAKEAAEYMQTVQNMGSSGVTDEDAEAADLDADSARDATRLLARSLYNSVKNMEEAYAAASEGISLAEESLRVTNLKYDVGLATKADVLAGEASLREAKKNLFDLKSKHAYMKKVLEMPWAYSPAA